MTDVHKNKIIKCYAVLVENMTVDGVIVCLIPPRLLTFLEIENISAHKGRAKQAQELLNTLLRKSDCAFDELVKALLSTNQCHLSDLLLREGKCSVFTWMHFVCSNVC